MAKSVTALLEVTSTERAAISSPLLGQIIYNSTTSQIEYWNGSAWIQSLNNIMEFVSNPGPSGVAGTPLFDVFFVVPGLLGTDTILSVTQMTAGASGTLSLLGWIGQADGLLTGKYVADPGTGSVILVAVKR